MIRVDFDPEKIAGAILLTDADLIDASALAVKLRDAGDPVSLYLRDQFPASSQQLLAAYNSAGSVAQPLLSALTNDLNQQIQGPPLFESRRFRGIVLERDTLIKAIIKQDPKGDDLSRLNRLLLEDVYSEEIAKSPRAEWEGWVSLAREATDNAIGKWETWKRNPGNPPADFEFKWDDSSFVWKGIRDWLLKYVFSNKCAYCETTVVGYIPDAEHFRPKGQVRTKAGIVKALDVDGVSEVNHPGYFWLAYHWQNLLPSCNTCNRYGGKLDVFPVANAHIAVTRITDQKEIDRLMNKLKRSQLSNDVFYLEPEALDLIEDRLLLHPYFDRPEEHLHFQVDGKAVADSNRGQASIDVLNLNDKNKVTQRNLTQTDAITPYTIKVQGEIPDLAKMKTAARTIRDEYYKGARPYGAAVFDYIHHWLGDSPLDPFTLLKDEEAHSSENSH